MSHSDNSTSWDFSPASAIQQLEKRGVNPADLSFKQRGSIIRIEIMESSRPDQPNQPDRPSTTPPLSPRIQAERWLSCCAAAGPMPTEVAIPERPLATLAELATLQLGQGKTLLILVPDDESLPDLSMALDLSLRPLCLVLPSADFAARIALRATISLLKSRLNRDADQEQEVAWLAQRRRINERNSLWTDATRWGAGNDRSPWPQDVAKLFPVRILPVAAYRELAAQAADLVVFYRCDLGLETAALPGQHLHVGQRDSKFSRHSVAINDEGARLRIELSQLTQDVADLELELATAQAEMTDFTRRYYEQVGRRMTDLDGLRAQVATQRTASLPDDAPARVEAEKLRAEAERSARESKRYQESQEEEFRSATIDPTPFRPSQDIKRLFRQLAQKIHPDRASDEADRAWRTQLMSEANRAYRAADADRLHEVAELWREGQSKLSPHTSSATKTGRHDMLSLQVSRMRQRFSEIQSELHRLFGSKLYELYVAARQAFRQGRDLLQEMADSLDGQISALRAELV